ncbi:MAG: alginate lyase family protein, partial [Terriglobales bacterium]
WKEVRTRGGQEFHKRSDLLRYRMRWRAEAIQLSPAAPQASTASKPKFFFDAGEAAERAALVRANLPHQAAAIIREADEICQHRFRLLGYENLDYGTDIDWHLDAVHNKRAPLDPWFKIPFLDFAKVGDHKITWELNRHQHLVTLAKAWLLTQGQDQKAKKDPDQYLRELIAQWRSWIKANLYPLGINWGSTLEVAFRSLSWIWVDQLLCNRILSGQLQSAASAKSVAEFRAELLPALAFQGRYIERYLSTYFSPNTHLLGEALALFFIGTLYPQMPRAANWKNDGWQILLNEARRQVRPDGVYFEQSLYYHVYALDFFLHARLLAAQNEIEVSPAYDDVVRHMLDVVEALAQAGPAEGFGDDDGGRLFNPRRNRTEHTTDPLALGALLYDSTAASAAPASAAQLTEESIWLFGERAIEKLPKIKRQSEPRSTAFSDGGLYVLASIEPYPQAMMIDAGPQGVGRCGHGHADALSLRLTMNGERWLVDSGSGVYISEDPAERNAFRGTAAHNTLRVDGADQATPDEPFSWKEIPTTRVETWLTGETFTYFAGSHNGYERLPGRVTHQRSVLRINGGQHSLWFVRDAALGAEEHDLELNWHFAADVQLHEEGSGEFVTFRPDAPGTALRLIVANTSTDSSLDQAPGRDPNRPEWHANITQGQISPAYGRYESASILRCTARAKLPAEIATALVADNRESHSLPRTSDATLISTQQAAVQIYELKDDADTTHNFFFARDKQPWSTGLWSSDAELVYFRVEHDELAQLIVIGGSSVAWRGKPLLNATDPFQFFEWRRDGHITNSSRDAFSTTPAFDELTRSLNSSPTVSHPTSTYAEKH